MTGQHDAIDLSTIGRLDLDGSSLVAPPSTRLEQQLNALSTSELLAALGVSLADF